MKVLGIDPGTHRMGWAILDGSPHKQHLVASGCLESPPHTSAPTYLTFIFQSLNKLIKTHSPQAVGLETLLFQKNLKTAISVAQARGVALLAATINNLPVHEIAPNTVKSTVAGHGDADKSSLKRMVGLLLSIDIGSRLDDETDAIAIGVTTLVTCKA